MTKKTTSERFYLPGLLAAFFLSCAGSPGSSGETHFLCSTTPDCEKRELGLVCVEGECRQPGDGGAEPGTGPGGSTGKSDPLAPMSVSYFVDVVDTSKCLPRTLTPIRDPKTGESHIPCALVEVRPGPTRECQPARGRTTPPASLTSTVFERLRQTGACDRTGVPSCDSFYVCELREASDACHHEGPATEVGWCYVDPSVNPDDDPTLVASCPAVAPRILHFVDPEMQTPAADAKVLIGCMSTPISGGS